MSDHTVSSSPSSDRTKPRALWVYAHPDARSLNRTLRDAGLDALRRTHEATTSDLYAMGFDPVLSEADLGGSAPVGTFLERWTTAQLGDRTPEPIRAEQRKLLEADLVVIQFPLWWAGLPAILKGWFDRVFAAGFAFDVVDPVTGRARRYGDGLLARRRALVVVSAGEHPDSLSKRGIAGDIESLLFPLTHGTLFYAGMEPLPLHVVTNADELDADDVERETDRLRRRLAGVMDEEPLPYRTAASGDYRPGRRLRDEFAPGRVDLGLHLLDA